MQSALAAHLAEFGSVDVRPMSGFQKVVARRLTQSWNQIPHVVHHDDVDVTALEAHRAAMGKAERISPLIYVVKALGSALAAFPQFNASLSEDGKSLFLKKYFHIGVAVDGPNGLLVPVLRDVDGKDVPALAAEFAELAAQARGKGLPMQAMSGGCITVTSLGGIGGTGFAPIINQPEVAILGVTPSRMVPVWDGAEFRPRLMLPLSLSYDHRVINGADAARFVRKIGELLGDPVGL